jgi:hypothetical protein
LEYKVSSQVRKEEARRTTRLSAQMSSHSRPSGRIAFRNSGSSGMTGADSSAVRWGLTRLVYTVGVQIGCQVLTDFGARIVLFAM